MTVTPLRQARYQAAVARRELGWTHQEIADDLGVTVSCLRNILCDPDGEKQRFRRERYRGVCQGCGAPTDGSSGAAKAPEWCAHCWPDSPAGKAAREAATVWTNDRIIAAIRWWADTYGEPPALPDWNPLQAEKVGDYARAERGRQLIQAGQIPWFTIVYNRFGSWNAAIAAAGYTPRAAHGGAGNQWRNRRNREKAPA